MVDTVAQPSQLKKGEQLPQSSSPFSWTAVCSVLSSGQLSTAQQGIAASRIK
ncbi:MAG: hypothetical protein JNK27_07935 [Chitinophagaceae bacterium]|nr:hypothetical protein [Chitinophagaceae bacterium]